MQVGNKLENARSILSIHPTEEDNDAYFMCQGIHPGLLQPSESMVQLSVMRKLFTLFPFVFKNDGIVANMMSTVLELHGDWQCRLL